MEKTYQVRVCGPQETLLVDLCDTEQQFKSFTVLQLKEKIIQKLPGNIDPEDIRLIFKDKRLQDDDETLSSYGVQHMSFLDVVLRLRRAERLQVTVNVVGPGGETKEVKVSETVEQLRWITVLQLKEKIEQEFGLPPPDGIRLVFAGKLLYDDLSVSDYGVQHGSTFHMCVRPWTGVQVFVETLMGWTKEVKVCDTYEQLQRIKILQLKEKIKHKFGLPHPDDISLFLEGKELKNDRYLSAYGVQHGSTLLMSSGLTREDRLQMGVYVTVVGPEGETKKVKVCETEEQLHWIKVLQLKEKITQAFDLPPPDVEYFGLWEMNETLDDDKYLSDHRVQNGSILQMISSRRRAERPQTGVQVTVVRQEGWRKKVKVCETVEQPQSITVLQLKEKIIQKLGLDRPDEELFQLFFRGKELIDDPHLSYYGVQHGSILRMVLRPQESAAAADHRTDGHKMRNIYQVFVRGHRGLTLVVDLCNTAEQFESITVWQLKEKIKQELPECDSANDFILVFMDKWLDDDYEILSYYGVQHKSVILLVLRVKGGGGSPPLYQRGGRGDRDGRRRSMERLANFHADGSGAAGGPCCEDQ